MYNILCQPHSKIFHISLFFDTICCINCNLIRRKSSYYVTFYQTLSQSDYGKPFLLFPPPIHSTWTIISPEKTVSQLPPAPFFSFHHTLYIVLTGSAVNDWQFCVTVLYSIAWKAATKTRHTVRSPERSSLCWKNSATPALRHTTSELTVGNSRPGAPVKASMSDGHRP